MEKREINPNSLPKEPLGLSPAQEQLALEAEILYLDHLSEDPNNKEATQNYVNEQMRLKSLINSLNNKGSSDA